MHGDFSRWTFDARRDYRAVLLQQGRVLLDADWNEQAELTRYHDEIRTLDTIGRAGGPADAAGFAIVDAAGNAPSGTAWTDLRITPGRYYVDGILSVARLREGAAGPGIPLTDQPYLAAIDSDPGLPEPPDDGRYALYLDVWIHDVTADEDPTLREPALGGPDTTIRARTIWQVRAVPLTAAEECSDLHDVGWLTTPRGAMTPSLKETPPEADPCQITSSGGYTRLENQLYRVEIHDVDGGTPRYLWSRENGSVVVGLVAIDANTPAGARLTVDRAGRDEELSIREGDTVEVTSADRQLRGEPGFLATTGAPDGLVVPVSWSGAAPASLGALGSAAILRRWEEAARPVGPGPDDLEGGIEVRFHGDSFSTGDFWLVPARAVRLAYGLTALSGTLDWPRDAAGHPVPAPPLGPVHHVTPLAVVTRDPSGWTRVSDCRRFVPSLDELVSIDLIGGDGQEAGPGGALPEPVRFAVRNGGLPVAGARIKVTAHAGKVTDGTADDTEIVTATGTDGVAAVRWTLATGSGAAQAQTLVAQRLDDHDNGIDVEVIATGRLAPTSAVRPPGLHVRKVVLNLEEKELLNDDPVTLEQLRNGLAVQLDGPVLKSSIEAVLDDHGIPIHVKPVLRVLIDLPWPTTRGVPVWQFLPLVGFHPVQLDAQCTAEGTAIHWDPTKATQNWLSSHAPSQAAAAPPPGIFDGVQALGWPKGWPLAGWLVIDGWAIIADGFVPEGSVPAHLNCHANTRSEDGLTRLILPTDDEIPGGQFKLWFNLMPPPS